MFGYQFIIEKEKNCVVMLIFMFVFSFFFIFLFCVISQCLPLEILKSIQQQSFHLK